MSTTTEIEITPTSSIDYGNVAPGELKVRVFRVEGRVRCVSCRAAKYLQAYNGENGLRRLLLRQGWVLHDGVWSCRRCAGRLQAGESLPEAGALVSADQALEELSEVRTSANLNANDLPMVKGTRVRPDQWAAFYIWWRTGSKEDACEAANISKWKLASWRKTEWWMALESEHTAEQNADFQADLMKMDDLALAAYHDLMVGADKDDRTVTAKIAAMKLRMGMGRSPVLATRPEHLTQIKVEGDLNLNKVNVDDISGDDVRAILTGEKPPPETIDGK